MSGGLPEILVTLVDIEIVLGFGAELAYLFAFCNANKQLQKILVF